LLFAKIHSGIERRKCRSALSYVKGSLTCRAAAGRSLCTV
jgi:hypothetical protein